MSNFRTIQMLLPIAALCAGAPRIAAAADRPNIVLILSASQPVVPSSVPDALDGLPCR